MGDNELMHYGVKGMKWGVRHDYIPKGRKRSSLSDADIRKAHFQQSIESSIENNKSLSKKEIHRRETTKKILIGTAIAVGVGGAAYLAYKHNALQQLGDTLDTIPSDASKAQQLDAAKPAMDKAFKETCSVLKEGTVFHRMES